MAIGNDYIEIFTDGIFNSTITDSDSTAIATCGFWNVNLARIIKFTSNAVSSVRLVSRVFSPIVKYARIE